MTKRNRRRRQITKPVIAMQAAVTITAGESADGPKRFDVVAYTGGPMAIKGYDHPVVVDLAGLSFGNTVIANLDHDRTKRVGHVTDKVVESGELRLGGFASAATASRDEVVESAAGGFTWQASIEAMPAGVRLLAEGKSETVNGRQVDGPAYITAKSNLRGFAFVTSGADDNTTVTIAATAGGDTMDQELREWIEGLGFDADEITAEQLEGLTADFDGREKPRKKKKASGGDGGTITELVAAQKAENERIEKITTITAEAIERTPYAMDEIEKLADRAIEGNWDAEKFELQLLRSCERPQATARRGRGQQDDRLSNQVVEAAVAITGGLADPEKAYNDQTLQAVRDRFPNGIGLQELFLIGAAANGHRGTSTQVTLDVQRAAFGLAPGGRRIEAAGFSTLSIPNILSNTANKFLLEGWMAVDQTWRAISSRRSVRDFKQVSSYSLTGGFDYEKVGPGGELPHGTVGEVSYTNQAETYGKMFAITRTDIVNDDLGALTAVPRRLGRGGALKLNNVFWTEFLNNSAFFAAGNSNVSTGATSAFDAAGVGLAKAEVVFMNQTDPDSNPLALMPAIVLVPTTLKTAALQVNESVTLKGDTDAGDANIFRGRFRVESSPYMENTGYTGYSTAAWYLLANPSDLSTIEVCFLNGRESPVVETADADFNVLGVQMRGYHDFGVNQQEYRAGVRSAGS